MPKGRKQQGRRHKQSTTGAEVKPSGRGLTALALVPVGVALLAALVAVVLRLAPPSSEPPARPAYPPPARPAAGEPAGVEKLTPEQCLADFERASTLQKSEPRWLPSRRAWDMEDLSGACDRYLAGLAVPSARCPYSGMSTARGRARRQLGQALTKIWQRAQADPSGGSQISPQGAEQAIFFVRNATARMVEVVEPPEDPPGLITWASLLEGTKPRMAAKMYSAALSAGEPESPMGYVFLHGTNEKAGDYAKAAKMLRRALELEEKAAEAERKARPSAEPTERDARILNLRDGLGETLLHAASAESLAEAREVLSALATDVRERVGEQRGLGRLVDISSRLGVLAYLQSSGGAAARHALDAMNGLATHLAAG